MDFTWHCIVLQTVVAGGGPVRITLLPSREVVVEHKHFTEVVPAFYGSCPSQASRFLILAFEVHGYGAELFA